MEGLSRVIKTDFSSFFCPNPLLHKYLGQSAGAFLKNATQNTIEPKDYKINLSAWPEAEEETTSEASKLDHDHTTLREVSESLAMLRAEA